MSKLKTLFCIWCMGLLTFSDAGTIVRNVWVPIWTDDIPVVTPVTITLPDKDNDGIEDSVDIPVAYAQHLTVSIGSDGYAIVLEGYDNDTPLSYTIVTQPAHGRLVGSAPNLTYIPDNGYTGEDHFTFKVDDGVHESSVATVYLQIIKPDYEVLSKSEASKFLSKATFGARLEDIEALKASNDYEKWIDDQLKVPPTYHMPWMEEHLKGVGGTPDLKDSLEDWKKYSNTMGYAQRDAWWHIATYAPDQLRQRVALALSEILVISRKGPLGPWPDARVSYYDVLVKHALDNFEDLLKEVTYHPAMGKYLSYLGNPKADPATGSHPDENYAREVMQLFTIGLYELNLDGTLKLKNGKPIATYTQTDIKEMAKVFTGLTDRNGFFFASDGSTSHASRTQSMIAKEEYHDTSAKHPLGHTINTGTTKGDIDAALHMLFEHPNTAPFISKQLIQRLVTSNPSPAYVERVASVFVDNGKGVRGDLGAVVKAILLDEEALRADKHPADFGKFREPLLYFTHLFRAFHAQGDANNTIQIDNGPIYRYESFNFNGTGMTQQEGPLEALTVFNYFAPDDGPASLKKMGKVAPELTIYGKRGIDDVLMGIINKNGFVYGTYKLHIDLDLSREIAFVRNRDFTGLIDHLDLILTGGLTDTQSKTKIVNYLKSVTTNYEDKPISDEELVRYAIGLMMTSPDYALQR